MVMACGCCCSPSKGSIRRWFWVVLQLAHFLVALSLLCVAVVEFSAEAPLFDVLGTDRQAIPQRVFQVSSCPTTLVPVVVRIYIYRTAVVSSLNSPTLVQ